MTMTCVLCDVADGMEPTEILYDDGESVAITPLRSMAPTHVLLFPRVHYDGLPGYLVCRSTHAVRGSYRLEV